MRKLFAALAFLGFSLFWACHLGPEDKADTFDLVADSSWFRCDTLEVVLLDGDGIPLDTLFRDRLVSEDQLAGLPADRYHGGRGQVRIRGFQEDGGACVDQKRTFEEGGGVVKIDTLRDPDAAIRSLSAFPDMLSLVLTGDPAVVEARVLPAFADPACYWSLDSTHVAALDVGPETSATRVLVSPKALGEAVLTLRSRKDGSRAAQVRVRVSSSAVSAVTLDNDSLILYVKGPGEVLTAVVTPFRADPRVAWHSADPAIAAVDSAGRVTPVAEGRTWVFAVSGNGKKDSAAILVLADAPVVTVDAPTGTPAGVPMLFRVRATHRIGHIVQLAWDLQGDGAWEDSLPGPWHGETVDFPEIQGVYAEEGAYTARFRVRDSEGNVTVAVVPVEVGNQPPTILSLRADTVISIKDSIVMSATARDRDGGVAWVGWDYEGDGSWDDTLAVSDSLVEFSRGHRFPDAGTYRALFRAADRDGRVRTVTVRIEVQLDAPVVDAGRDTTVLVGSDFLLRAKASDGFGTLVKSEIRLVGGGAFSPLYSLESTIKVPNTPDTMAFVIRVTDDDGLTGEDTVKVVVIMSANADLATLALSTGTLSPDFSPGTSSYQVRVPFADSVLTVTPTARDTSAAIEVAGRRVASGSPSQPIPLAVGSTPVVIGVSSPDGSLRVYSLSVVREPSADATLKSLVVTGFTLRPAFAPNVLQYIDTVANAVTSVTFRPTAASPGATIVINGTPVASGTPATAALPVGFNRVEIVVTAMDSSSRTSYVLWIARRAKVYVHRKLGAAAPVLADSMEVPLSTARPVSAAVPVGYRFVRWVRQEGASTFADSLVNPALLTVQAGVVRVQAQMELLRYTINATALGNCGTVSPAGAIGVDHGGTQAFTFAPNPGCRLQSVRVDGTTEVPSPGTSYTFQNVTGNRTLETTFAPLGKVTLTSAVGLGAGTITPASVSADSGSTQTFVFKPASGYRFQDLRDNNVAVTPTSGDTAYTLTGVNAAHHVVVRFRRRYTVTVQQSGCGAVNPGTSQVDSAAGLNFNFQPLQGCKVDSLFVNGASLAPAGGHSFSNVTANQSLRVVFTRMYGITTTAGTGGSVSPVNPVVDSLDNVTLSISPAAGYRRAGLTVDGAAVTPVPASYTFNRVTAAHTLAATFQRVHTITVSQRGCANVTPGTTVYDAGASAAFSWSARPAGCRIDSVIVDNAAVSGPNGYTFTALNADHTLRVVSSQGYGITTTWGTAGSNGAGGNITPANPTVPAGANQTLAINPATGYRRLSLTVNGSAVTPVPATYTFTNIQANQTAHAAFLRTFTLGVTWSGCGSVSPGGGVVDTNSNTTFNFAPSTGCRVDSVFEDGDFKGSPSSYAFNRVDRNHTLRVVFVRTYRVTTSVATNGTANVGGTISPASPLVDSLDAATFNITPSAGYRRLSLVVDGGQPLAPAATYTFPSVTSARSLHADFMRTFRVQTFSNVAGQVTSPADQIVDSNGTFQVRWNAAPTGYRFAGFKVNDNPVSPNQNLGHNLLVQEAAVCSVLYVRQIRVTGSGTPAAGGTVTPADAWYNPGATATVTVTPASGYYIAEIRDNGVVVPPSDSDPRTHRIVSLPGLAVDHEVTATFAPRQIDAYVVYGLTNDPNAGRVDPEKAEVPVGSSHTLRFLPSQGYFAYSIREGGSILPFNSGSGSYTLPAVDRQRVLDVEFMPEGKYIRIQVFSMAHIDPTVVPPSLCVRTRDMEGCTDKASNSVTRGSPVGSDVLIGAAESMCPNPDGRCDDAELLPFRHWQDETGQTYTEREMGFPGFETHKQFQAVYGRRIILPPRDGIDPPILLESAPRTSGGN